MPEMDRIAGARGDSKQKTRQHRRESGALPKQLNRVRSRSSLRGGIHRKPRVIRDALLGDAYEDFAT